MAVYNSFWPSFKGLTPFLTRYVQITVELTLSLIHFFIFTKKIKALFRFCLLFEPKLMKKRPLKGRRFLAAAFNLHPVNSNKTIVSDLNKNIGMINYQSKDSQKSESSSSVTKDESLSKTYSISSFFSFYFSSPFFSKTGATSWKS